MGLVQVWRLKRHSLEEGKPIKIKKLLRGLGARKGRKASCTSKSANIVSSRTGSRARDSTACAFVSRSSGVRLGFEPTPNKVHLPLACGLR